MRNGRLNVKLKDAMKCKRGYQIGNTKIDKRGDSPVFEIDKWNFQQMLDLGFS